MNNHIPLDPRVCTLCQSLDGPVMQSVPAEGNNHFYTILREYYLEHDHLESAWSTEFAILLREYCNGRQFPQPEIDEAFCVYARRV